MCHLSDVIYLCNPHCSPVHFHVVMGGELSVAFLGPGFNSQWHPQVPVFMEHPNVPRAPDSFFVRLWVAFLSNSDDK